jgi:alkylation response protein AidB-like acyl-CoA dehydrogenase
MAATPDYGGQGLPSIAHTAVGEMLCSAAMAWRMASGLSEGAVLALTRHGSQQLKDHYLEKLVTGAWTGTMCLTEPQAGTDLGILRSRAEPAADGSYRVSGTKIFISWTTSSTSCSRGCPTPRPARAASACFWCPS